MSQAEITSLATLASTIIAALIIIWRTLISGSVTKDVSTKVDTVASRVNGPLDALISLVEEIHDNTVPKTPK